MENNPYSPPTELLHVKYFATEERNLTFRELWRTASPTLGGKALAVLVKLFRLTSPPQIGFAFNEAVRSEPSGVPELKHHFKDTIATLETLGYQEALAMKIPVIGDGFAHSLAFLGDDPTTFAMIHQAEVRISGYVEGDSGVSFLSQNSTTIWPTSNMRQTSDLPSIFDAAYLPGADPRELHAAHCARMQPVATSSLRRFTHDVLWDTLCENESTIHEFNLLRGVFRPMTLGEVENCIAAQPDRTSRYARSI